MKKLAAVLMALAMAVPAFAEPVCASACGGGPAVNQHCCCGPKAAPTDGLDSYSSVPCCPSGSTRADERAIDSAFPSVQTTVAGTTADTGPAPALVPADPAAPLQLAALAVPLAVARPPGRALFLLSSSLRL